ncbi:hypothetical protein [Massilia sp. CF038]|uniref:hypothetical protein n=1 Tax=Massilia sp. CF038 TaxID=1881045 RepID=UPI000910CD9A|nr:hypothetical protein [Massilia sp. CF038]SHH55722.1 hypothetical protein SAMN05428948_4450 [Massilia sp. CF038]
MNKLADAEKIAQGRARWLCMDCQVDTYQNEQYYMLWYRVWRSIHYKIDGMLCLDCAEKRLGRELTGADFSKARVNQGQAKVCAALAMRLNRVA